MPKTSLTKSKIQLIMWSIEEHKSIRSIMAAYHISFPTYKKIEKQYQAIHSPKPAVTKQYLMRRSAIFEAHTEKRIDDLTMKEQLDDLKQHYGSVQGKFEIDKILAMNEQGNKKNPKGVPLPRITYKRKKSNRIKTVRELKHLQQLKELRIRQKQQKTIKGGK